ncbi:Aquaporin-1, partial [Eudyptes schlegeli]
MASEFKKKIFWRAVVAEFLAMTLFIFISIGSALGFSFPVVGNKTSTRSQDNVKVSLAFGLSIATMAQSVGHISGAHLNPAVTLGLLLSCQISIFKALMYIIAQCLGAVVATAILSGVTSSLPNNLLGLNSVNSHIDTTPGAWKVTCFWNTLWISSVIGCVSATTAQQSVPKVGSSVAEGLVHVRVQCRLVINTQWPSPNPFSKTGRKEPFAVLDSSYQGSNLIFWVGPIIGGASAALIYDFILAPRSSDLTDRVKVWTSGQVEEYDLEGDDMNSRVEMKPK